MTKNESKLLSIQGIAKASAFCLLLSAFSVNAAMATPASAGTVDEVMAVQQGKKVTGVVVDGTGEPVIGANVVVKGTTNGTITDFDGNYSLEGVPADGVLVFSYIGYLSQEIPVGNQSMIKVTLKEDTQTLDEVVVVGYGTMKKSDVTGSISTAKGDDLVKNQSFSALDNLRGKVSGVNIFSNSSQPGAYSNRVVIRGIATINSSSNPLYVVDGVVMENFDLVNPNDIESMEVLKDASAAAIYGARGANGVIMVTTKRGKKDGEGVAISYQGSVSVSSIARKMDLLNAQEWTDTFMKGLENENKWLGTNWSLNRTDWFTDRNYFDANGNPIYDTDWQDEATRTAVSHNHQLNIQQAGKNSSMGAFLNYTDQQGIMLNTYNKRLNAKMAYDADPTKWLSTSVNVLVNHTWGRYTPEDGGGQEARRTMIEMLPWLPVYEPGTNKYTTSTSPSLSGFNLEGMSNPVFILNDQRRMKYNTQIFGNAALTFHLAEGLDLKTQFGLDSHNITYRGYSSVGLNNISMPNGWAEYENWNTLYWQEETYLTYNKVLGDHRINAMAGLSWQERTYRRNKSKTEGFSDDFYEDYNMIVGTTPKSPESDWTRWAMNSYFLRFAYTYKDRYSATVTGRIDGSSKFGDNNKYAFFPSAGLAWNISQEDFLKDNNVISNLKLHTSYGLTGNSEIDPYKSLGKIKSETLLLNGTRAPYSYMETMPNPDLKWEKTGQFDVGFNLGLFHNRLNFDVSYYNKKTTDLLLDCPVPHSTGFSTIFKNIGSVRNQGLDIMVNGTPVQGEFTWNSTVNLNFNKNEILHLGDTDADVYLYDWVGGGSILRVGESMGSFYGLVRNGIFTEEDYKAGKCEKNQIGRPDRSESREIIGKGLPDWTGSWVNNFSYKNFDLTVDFQFVWGVETLQRFMHSTYDRFGMTNGLSNILYDGYNGTNAGTMEQAIFLAYDKPHGGGDTTTDSQWVANGSYLRLNMLQLGYTFDSSVAKKVGLSGLRLYLSGNNLFQIVSKDFLGYDPESTSEVSSSSGVSSGSQFGQNMTFFSYPRARTFTFGVNVTF
ncbi:SusC/RagA family TonB-linked outer membrane protein [Parabacteroides distasonis]|uniref:TonB-dependent receptor n=1 Tax=Parabacteroides distasonis TaxID=823 RepID=A0A5C6KMX5_PARDI|nr:TonB-dependent receptor [Parabacteroides distasonis]TWV64567.1 TonB-dependent receptor [Parabacteroides distasonis]